MFDYNSINWIGSTIVFPQCRWCGRIFVWNATHDQLLDLGRLSLLHSTLLAAKKAWGLSWCADQQQEGLEYSAQSARVPVVRPYRQLIRRDRWWWQPPHHHGCHRLLLQVVFPHAHVRWVPVLLHAWSPLNLIYLLNIYFSLFFRQCKQTRTKETAQNPLQCILFQSSSSSTLEKCNLSNGISRKWTPFFCQAK